jgi:hypothetical protein
MKNNDLNPKQLAELFNTICTEYGFIRKRRLPLDLYIQNAANGKKGTPRLNYYIDSNLRIRVNEASAYEWVLALLVMLMKQEKVEQQVARHD